MKLIFPFRDWRQRVGHTTVECQEKVLCKSVVRLLRAEAGKFIGETKAGPSAAKSAASG